MTVTVSLIYLYVCVLQETEHPKQVRSYEIRDHPSKKESKCLVKNPFLFILLNHFTYHPLTFFCPVKDPKCVYLMFAFHVS